VPQTSDDAVLGGRLLLRQPLRGHRFGHDAILLAAATDGRSGEHAVDLGAGVGAAGLALAARVAGLRVTLIEIDAGLCELAARNARSNGLADRVQTLMLDVSNLNGLTAAGLGPASADRVLMNPPFNDPSHASPDAGRRKAHVTEPDTLSRWIAAAGHLLKPAGVLTLIWRADGWPAVRAALAPAFGSLAVLPIVPREGAAAIRVLVRAQKDGRMPAVTRPALALNDSRGRPTAAAEAVLRGGETLAFGGS
jgi:tRNA1(Val) A37 N6-methylase TrmN6